VTEDVHGVAAAALEAIAAAQDPGALDAARTRFLGRGDGELTVFRKQLGSIADQDARRQMGKTVNELVERVTVALDERKTTLAQSQNGASAAVEAMDLTWPPQPLMRGHVHPVTKMLREIRRIFTQIGYISVSGPEIEYDRYNFELVNMPPGHPSRDTQDTFFIDEQRLLRTHTSPVQIRSMVSLGTPLRVIIPGKAFRRDNDSTHSPMFHQVEGLCVDIGINLGDLKGTLEYFCRSLFGRDRKIRLRPHHFEYTEPSVEVDVSCMVCGGDGCNTCRGSGWIELLGAGMVHRNVLGNGGIDPDLYSGFAFGMGIERAAQLAYYIDDIRAIYDNDVRLVRQG
jgi:phenylalanyl-tRNA synthetase alpha chain